jgi:glyceraldehyde 3-phosphate dehydrogenase
MEGNLVRVLSWYDNEWGFSNRMVDTAGAIGRTLEPNRENTKIAEEA